MERRSSKREHHGQHHRSSTNLDSEHHRPHETKRHASGHSKRTSTHHELSKDTLVKPPLSGDDDYVRSWLAQTNKEIEVAAKKAPNLESRPAERREGKQIPQLDLRSFRDGFHEAAEAQQHPKRKRRHRSSSDSSLVEPVLNLQPRPRRGEPKPHDDEREEPVSHQPKKRKIASSESGSSAESQHHETFEKRDRHKTREDLYEPKKEKKKKHKSDEQDGARKSKKKREKKGDKKKAARKAGEDLMNNFASEKVSQDRLTIRTHGPGLFRNGRASSPARRRGIPDLVFSEMEFLQHPPRHSDIQATSKSRGKDERKALREQDEISMFFKPTRTPLAETSPNVGRERSSTYMSEEQSLYIRQGVKDRNRSHSFDLMERIHSGNIRPGLSSERFLASRGRTPSTQRMLTVPETTSRLSENTTTAVTWSETQVSPGATVQTKRRKLNNPNDQSPTPEPIRRSIENTGIFRDTGIERRSSTSSRAKATLSQELLHQKQQLRDGQDQLDFSHQISNTSQPRLTSRDQRPSSEHRPPKRRDRLPHNSETHNESASEDLVNKRNPRIPAGIGETTQHSRIIVEHYDPSQGWYRQQELGQLENTLTGPHPDAETLRETKSTPLTREQIAKDARVKRPATTTPVETISEETVLQRKNNPNPADPATPGEISSNRALLDTVHGKHILRAASVRASGPAAKGESCSRPSPEDVSEAVNHGNDGQKQDEIDGRLPAVLLAQYGGWLEAAPRAVLPISRNGTPNIENTRPGVDFIAGLPMRGPSGGSLRLSPRSLHLSIGGESAPLYLNQIQRQHPPRPLVPDIDFGNNHLDGRGAFDPEMVEYIQENEYNVLEEQNYQGGDYEEYPMYEHREELESHVEVPYDEPRMWQPVIQGGEMMQHYEAWEGRDPDIGYEFTGGYNGQGLTGMHAEGQGILYEDPLPEEVPMAGFWRHNRPF